MITIKSSVNKTLPAHVSHQKLKRERLWLLGKAFNVKGLRRNDTHFNNKTKKYEWERQRGGSDQTGPLSGEQEKEGANVDRCELLTDSETPYCIFLPWENEVRKIKSDRWTDRETPNRDLDKNFQLRDVKKSSEPEGKRALEQKPALNESVNVSLKRC